MQSSRERIVEILDEVKDQITAAREGAYGDPRVQHKLTAELFSAYLQATCGLDVQIDAEDVCVFNILQKLARHACGEPKKDTAADVIGYGANLWAVMEAERAGEPQRAPKGFGEPKAYCTVKVSNQAQWSTDHPHFWVCLCPSDSSDGNLRPASCGVCSDCHVQRPAL